MTNLISIYIPCISSDIAEYIILTNLKDIGNIFRVDFITQNKKLGFTENCGKNISVFVHFNYLYNNYQTTEILNNLNNNLPYYYYPILQKREYWILLKAKNPIPHTFMNNAQIVDNCRYLENKIQKLEDNNEKLEDFKSVLENKIEELVKTIQKLEEKHEKINVTGEWNKELAEEYWNKYWRKTCE